MRYNEILAIESATGAGIIKPVKPLTPAQAAHEADRRAGIQRRIHDQQAATVRKIADLRTKLASR